jgi:Alcohol dehydrogenase GroES-like domain
MPDQNALGMGGRPGGRRPGRSGARIPAGWVAVDVAYAGLCGSDLHIAAGEHVRAQPGIILGHEGADRTPPGSSSVTATGLSTASTQ